MWQSIDKEKKKKHWKFKFYAILFKFPFHSLLRSDNTINTTKEHRKSAFNKSAV